MSFSNIYYIYIYKVSERECVCVCWFFFVFFLAPRPLSVWGSASDWSDLGVTAEVRSSSVSRSIPDRLAGNFFKRSRVNLWYLYLQSRSLLSQSYLSLFQAKSTVLFRCSSHSERFAQIVRRFNNGLGHWYISDRATCFDRTRVLIYQKLFGYLEYFQSGPNNRMSVNVLPAILCFRNVQLLHPFQRTIQKYPWACLPKIRYRLRKISNGDKCFLKYPARSGKRVDTHHAEMNQKWITDNFGILLKRHNIPSSTTYTSP